MRITKVVIENFKCYAGRFEIDLNKELNILVGDNESGKSTIIEAIHLALRGWIYGKYLQSELNQSIFNNSVVLDYIEKVTTDDSIPPPRILIELYFEITGSVFSDSFISVDKKIDEVGSVSIFKALYKAGVINKHGEIDAQKLDLVNNSIHDEFVFVKDLLVTIVKKADAITAIFEGNGNSSRQKACGIQFFIKFDDRYKGEYCILQSTTDGITSLPIEFYTYYWSTFARDDRVTPKLIPIKSHLIDSSGIRGQNGSDVYISRIIRDLLSEENKMMVSQAYRSLKDTFASHPAIDAINKEIKQKQISEKKVELLVEDSTKTAWETSLMTYLDDIPFDYIGRGEQSLVKTKLALSHKKSLEANVLLIEEPENHLSHTKLNSLIEFIKESNRGKQILISTHNSFVANKLGLDNLILLNVDDKTKQRKKMQMKDLKSETRNFFEKLPGYDTLRLLMCKKAILVEGPSDELVVQKAYLDQMGMLPIHDEIDVISVGTSFLRFLEVASIIGKSVAVVTDNDGDYATKVIKKYQEYSKHDNIKICADSNITLNTLEPQLVEANKSQLEQLIRVLNIDPKVYTTQKSISDYMESNKTDYALKIFETPETINFPQYITDAIDWVCR